MAGHELRRGLRVVDETGGIGSEVRTRRRPDRRNSSRLGRERRPDVRAARLRRGPSRRGPAVFEAAPEEQIVSVFQKALGDEFRQRGIAVPLRKAPQAACLAPCQGQPGPFGASIRIRCSIVERSGPSMRAPPSQMKTSMNPAHEPNVSGGTRQRKLSVGGSGRRPIQVLVRVIPTAAGIPDRSRRVGSRPWRVSPAAYDAAFGVATRRTATRCRDHRVFVRANQTDFTQPIPTRYLTVTS